MDEALATKGLPSGEPVEPYDAQSLVTLARAVVDYVEKGTDTLAPGVADNVNGPWDSESQAYVDNLTLKSLFFSEDWVYIVVDLIADTISNQYLRVVRKAIINGKTRLMPEEGHPLQGLLDNPNKWQDQSSFIYNYLVELLLGGNAICWFAPASLQLLMLGFESIFLEFDSRNFGRLNSYLMTQVIDDLTPARARSGLRFDPAEIIHQRRPNPASLWWGLSPFIPGRKSVLFNRYSQDYLNGFYQKQATPGMALMISKEANEDKALRLLASFENVYSGRRNARRTLILPKGVDVKTLAHSIADQEFRDLTTINQERILGLLKVPKHALSLAETGSLGSEEAKQALRHFWTACLKPTMRKMAGTLTAYFRRRALLGRDHELEFDISDVEILREDELSKMQLATGQRSFRTLNEVRAKVYEDEPLPGGDELPHAAGGKSSGGAGGATGLQTVTAMTQVLADVAGKKIPREAGIAILMTGLALSAPEAEAIMGEVGRTFEPPPAPVPPTPPAPGAHPPPPAAEGDKPPPAPTEVPAAPPQEDPQAKALELKTARAKAIGTRFKDALEAGAQAINDQVEKHREKMLTAARVLLTSMGQAAATVVAKELQSEHAHEHEKGLATKGAPQIGAAKPPDEAELKKRLTKANKELRERWLQDTSAPLGEAVDVGYKAQLATLINQPAYSELMALGEEDPEGQRLSLKARGLKSFAQISETTTKWVMDVVSDGVKAQKSVEAIAKDIAAEFATEEAIAGRAETIARTETLTAVSVGQAAAAQNAAEVIPDLKKAWVNSDDERVRGNPDGKYPNSEADHWSLQGELVEHDGEFSNGLEYPRDPRGKAAETINCRCSWILVHPDDAASLDIPSNE